MLSFLSAGMLGLLFLSIPVAITLLLLAFGVLRPMLNKLAAHGRPMLDIDENGQQVLGDDQLSLSDQSIDINQLKELASTIARDDPKRVAQVMNQWVASDE